MGREYNSYGRDQINFEHVGRDVHVHETPAPTRPREEQILLEAVESEVESRLAQSLHHAVWINLSKESQPQPVYRPWERELHIGVKPPTLLPPDQTIEQAFNSDEINGKLLILGQPGAGKTTSLLDLAKVLVERARGNVGEPIPVILNLSSWKDEKQPIREWMVERLNPQYGVSVQLGQKWLSQRKLLPLLDGLDEVAPERQQACVSRINEFLTGENSPLEVVVCSRIEEYNNLQTQLLLNGAVCLKALTDEQIETYLNDLERSWLWQTIVANEKLLNLVRSPLLLSITVLTYPEASGDQLEQLQRASVPIQFLLDEYVKRMLHRQLESRSYGKRKAPSAKKTRRWLVWLAQQMERQSQTEFLIEEMQPSMLPNRQRWQNRLLFGLIGVLIGVLIEGMLTALKQDTTPLYGLAFVVMGVSCTVLLGETSIQPVETFEWSWHRGLSTSLMVGIGSELFIGLFAALMGWLIRGTSNGLIEGLISGLRIGVPGGLTLGLFSGMNGLRGKSIDTKVSPNQGMKKSAKFGLICGLFSCPICGLFFWLIWGLTSGITGGLSMQPTLALSLGLVVGPFVGLICGGLACLKHFILRLFLYRNHSIPWNYARFLNYSTERLFLQRVGGRYRFIHKYLQDHFAAMRLE